MKKRLKCTRTRRHRRREFINKLSPLTPSTKVWSTLQSMDGQEKLALPDNPVNARDRSAITDKSKPEIAVKTYAAARKVQITIEDSKKAYLMTRAGLKGTTKEKRVTVSLKMNWKELYRRCRMELPVLMEVFLR